MAKPTPETLEARRRATTSILKIVDLHRIHHQEARLAAVTDLARARAGAGEQTCEDIASEICRRMQR